MKFFLTLLASILSLGLATPIENQFVPSIGKTNSRIIGGESADPGQFPWQVAVLYYRLTSSGYCGGALISDQWVVTSAYCISSATRGVSVELGMILLDDRDRIQAAANETVVHPDYSPETLANDIALVKLSKPVELSDLIKPIELPEANDTTGGDVNVTVSGWGRTHAGGDLSVSLNYASLTTITNEDCDRYYPLQVQPGTLCCTGDNFAGPCGSDDGGPLITNTDNGPVLVGITSWIDDKGCETNYPSGYTRISTYREWIYEISGV